MISVEKLNSSNHQLEIIHESPIKNAPICVYQRASAANVVFQLTNYQITQLPNQKSQASLRTPVFANC
jgi:hypothetical protein